MRKKFTIGLILVLAVSMITGLTAFAQEGEPLPCTGEQVSGTVVAVDEEAATVTIDTGDGVLCTVTINEGTYQHPIVALLGTYFDDLAIEDYSSNLQDLQGCVLQDTATLEWMWVDCETEGSLSARVSGRNEDGSFSIQVEGMEDPVAISIDDPDAAENIDELLEALVISWNLNEEGNVIQAGDEIAAYHDDGIGFGVLVKLYAMAQESQEACLLQELEEGEVCGATVEELVAAVQYEGVGIGQLYKTFGKPAMVGVGHVRQDLRDGKGKPPWAGPKDKWGEDVSDDGESGEMDESSIDDGSQPPGQGNPKDKKNNGNGNGNGNNNGNGNRPPKGDPPGKGGPPRGNGKK